MVVHSVCTPDVRPYRSTAACAGACIGLYSHPSCSGEPVYLVHCAQVRKYSQGIHQWHVSLKCLLCLHLATEAKTCVWNCRHVARVTPSDFKSAVPIHISIFTCVENRNPDFGKMQLQATKALELFESGSNQSVLADPGTSADLNRNCLQERVITVNSPELLHHYSLGCQRANGLWQMRCE